MQITKSTIISAAALTVVLIGIPLLVVIYESDRTGQSTWAYLKRKFARMGTEETHSGGSDKQSRETGPVIKFVEKTPIGDPVGEADEFVSVPGLRDPSAFALRVVGDSMESTSAPSFREGDLVVLERGPVKGREFAFARVSGAPPVLRQVHFEGAEWPEDPDQTFLFAPLLGAMLDGEA